MNPLEAMCRAARDEAGKMMADDRREAVVVAHKILSQLGYTPPDIKLAMAIAAYVANAPNDLSERIKKAPRAWAIKIYDYPIDVEMLYVEKDVAEEDAENMGGSRVVPVALVELTPEEVGGE